MAVSSQPLINIGAAANDGTGDHLRTAFLKVNRLPNTDNTVNPLSGDYSGTYEQKLTAAIADAVVTGKKYCWVTQPYTPSLVTFNAAIRMFREGGDPTAYDVRAYGATGDGLTDDALAIQTAITASISGIGSVYIPDGNYRLLSSPTITSELVVLRGAGVSAALQPVNGPGLIVNTPNTGVVGPVIDSITLTPQAAAGGQFLLDVLTGVPGLRDITITNGGVASGWAGAIRLSEVNGGLLDNVHIQGTDSDRWPIGLDLCPGVTGNRGNITVLGGFINRPTIGARIGSGAIGVVNNIQFIGTKFLYNGSGTAVGGIGVQAMTMRLLTLLGVHIESYDISCELTTVLGADIRTTRLVNFAVPGTGPTKFGLSLKTACKQVTVAGCEFDSGTGGSGTCINLDATAHAEISIHPNRYAAFGTRINDLGTGSSRLDWTADASGFNFWFKDKVRANRYLSFSSNVTLGAGNNNNVAQPAGGTWRVTNDAGGSTMTGIAGGVTGDRIRLINVAGGSLTLTHNDTANSTAANCFFTRTAASVVVLANGMVDIEYDASTTRWRVGPVS